MDGYNQKPDIKRKDFGMTDAGAGFLFAVLGILGVQMLLAIVWGIGMANWGWPDISVTQSTSFLFQILTGLALQAALALFYWLYTRNRNIDPFRAPRIERMPARNWLLSAAAGVVALFGLMFTSFAFDLLFTDVFGYITPEVPGFDSLGRAVSGVLIIGIFPAVFEELIFRGMVLRGLKDLGKWKAVLISAAAFTLTHMNPSQTVHQFLLGVVLGLVAWETGSILAPMLIHFINNALAIILEYSGFFGLLAMEPWQIIVVAAVTFCAVCGIMYFILRYIRRPNAGKEGERGVPVFAEEAGGAARKKITGERNALLFLLSGFIVTACVWIATLVLGITG